MKFSSLIPAGLASLSTTQVLADFSIYRHDTTYTMSKTHYSYTDYGFIFLSNDTTEHDDDPSRQQQRPSSNIACPTFSSFPPVRCTWSRDASHSPGCVIDGAPGSPEDPNASPRRFEFRLAGRGHWTISWNGRRHGGPGEYDLVDFGGHKVGECALADRRYVFGYDRECDHGGGTPRATVRGASQFWCTSDGVEF